MKKAVSVLLCILLILSCSMVSVTANGSSLVPDAALKAAIAAELNIRAEDVDKGALERLTSLDLTDGGVSSFEGLQYAKNLTVLRAANCPVENAAPLSGLRLETVDLSGTGVSSVSAFSGMKSLRQLFLCGTSVSDIASLSSVASELMVLDISDTAVSDLSPLSKFSALTMLSVSGVPAKSLSPVLGLTGLRVLHADRLGITDAKPFAAFSSLRYLRLEGNRLTDIAALMKLPRLEKLDIRGNAFVFTEGSKILGQIDALAESGVEVISDRPTAEDYWSNRLSSLSVLNAGLDRAFDPADENLSYSCEVPYEIESLSVSAVTLDRAAHVSVTGNKLEPGRTNDVRVTVTRDGLEPLVYHIYATRGADPDASQTESSGSESSEPLPEEPEPSNRLASLVLPNIALDRAFDPADENLSYSCEVPFEYSTLPIQAVPADPKAIVIVYDNTLIAGKTVSVTVAVIRAGIGTRKYTIEAARLPEPAPEEPESGESAVPESSAPVSSAPESSAPSAPESGASSLPESSGEASEPESPDLPEQPELPEGASTALAGLFIRATDNDSFRVSLPVGKSTEPIRFVLPASVNAIDIEALASDKDAEVSVIIKNFVAGKEVPVYIGVRREGLRTRYYTLLVSLNESDEPIAPSSVPAEVRFESLWVRGNGVSGANGTKKPEKMPVEEPDEKPAEKPAASEPAKPDEKPVTTAPSVKLKALSVKGVAFNYPFAPENAGETYECTVPAGAKTLDITAIPADPQAKVKIYPYELTPGKTANITIGVSRDGLDTLYYTIRAACPPSGAVQEKPAEEKPASPVQSGELNKLKALSVKGVSFNYPFKTSNSGETYECSVPYSMETLDITAIPVSAQAKVKIYPYELTPGKTTNITIGVSHPETETLYYTIRVTRAGAAKPTPPVARPMPVSEHSVKLKTLEVKNATFLYPFKTTNSGETYEMTAPAGTTKLDIHAVAVDKEATVRIYNNELIDGTECHVTIGVSHPGMDALYYTLIVKVGGEAPPPSSEPEPEPEPESSSEPEPEPSADLVSLRVGDVTISPAFDPNDTVRIYYCSVAASVDHLTILAEKKDPMATIAVTGNNLVAGAETPVIVTVSREGIPSKTYTIFATRAEEYHGQYGSSSEAGSSLPESSAPESSEAISSAPESSAPESSAPESSDDADSNAGSRAALGIVIVLLLVAAAAVLTLLFLRQNPKGRRR